ncbi:uncharacterized protein MONBRDRAFT_32964 [Monosiga brevicollis MX1]|uniref:Protein kinase domain-containing protein n=1 Tax=Monosiga brevicollis TaxID=81824 RepID=A9V2S2_MONBE|nr:uncharacterized protein MONBRDRAFT_32964 [Monosiga brevicollis MX1]EDQ88062.1 predicted protein [Monosiga brevicollis MX1]|eukprot:XP_001747138.1 hypothetical protein [Monosiga brevicollis MX1]
MASEAPSAKRKKAFSFQFTRIDNATKFSPVNDGTGGEGTYGEVKRCRHVATQQIVALKKIKTEQEANGFPQTALREIQILKQLRHENIVQLQSVAVVSKECLYLPQHALPLLFTDKECPNLLPPEVKNTKSGKFCYMVLEFVDHDLNRILTAIKAKKPAGSRKSPVSTTIFKGLALQMLRGLDHLEKNCVLHRDLKPANILLSAQGVIKLADFGLAKYHHPDVHNERKGHTALVCSQWYRPPELLAGQVSYPEKIDSWSLAVVMGELFNLDPLFDGRTSSADGRTKAETYQFIQIQKLCGTDSFAWLEDCPLLPAKGHKKRQVSQRFNTLIARDRSSEAVVAFMDKALTVDPNHRLLAGELLKWEHKGVSLFNGPTPTLMGPGLMSELNAIM